MQFSGLPDRPKPPARIDGAVDRRRAAPPARPGRPCSSGVCLPPIGDGDHHVDDRFRHARRLRRRGQGRHRAARARTRRSSTSPTTSRAATSRTPRGWSRRRRREFPHGTIHVVVVDPGVGGARREVIVESSGQWYVGPDNGVFALRRRCLVRRVGDRGPRSFRGRRVSPTFHGRDVFAHAAAALARGEPATEAGPPVRLAGRAAVGAARAGARARRARRSLRQPDLGPAGRRGGRARSRSTATRCPCVTHLRGRRAGRRCSRTSARRGRSRSRCAMAAPTRASTRRAARRCVPVPVVRAVSMSRIDR